MDRRASMSSRSVLVQIPDQLPTLFEPQKAIMTPNIRAGVDDDDDGDAAPPERRLTVLALQLAVLEKAASRLGTLGFIWATVVLLGGFAITLGRTDFWCITVLLVVEGARILGRSHELEWQHEATWRSPVSSAAGLVFYWMQLLSASACVALSLVRLVHQRYGGSADARTNRSSALDIFYGLALAEALLFLVEKALWQWRVGHRRLIERVAKECHLAGACGAVAVRRFFYDSYSRCLNGSIFDGLHMDLVSYADDLLTAGSYDEQRLGASVLVALAESDRFADATLRRIGTSAPVTERLIEMLSWKNSSEKGVRRSAAVVVSMLTEGKLNALRVTGIPGAIESVASLLYADLDELNLLGLSILNKLAHDHDICDKIGKTKGLLDKIISYSSIASAPATAAPTDTNLMAVKQSLRVVKRLASTTGTTGKLLRRELSGIVFTGKVLNIFLGLAAQMLRFMEPEELRASLAAARVTDAALAKTMVQVLREYSRPSMVVPRIRRYTIELAVAMMRSDKRYVALFVELGMEDQLRRVAGTTSELECFNVFSGSVGLSRRGVSVCADVEAALELMRQA
ncbi:Os03g0145400 [Oryza sativa Japonica Group]|uniref:Os03g0145400 protein n=1 Tax=Oryza sativa subsp. japonica TaxID=39947 RepID=A0A0P0VT01_ORYSJ|nr:Os03g0145400 [Oryza sativa Japonica Group]